MKRCGFGSEGEEQAVLMVLVVLMKNWGCGRHFLLVREKKKKKKKSERGLRRKIK